MSFSERESLLLEVLREAGRPIVGADLADLLGVSPRTLRYDIGRINRVSGVALVESTPAGYSLSLAAYRTVLAEAPPVASVLDDDERLLVHLLDRDACDLFDAARDCYLSEAAVRSCVARLARRLAPQGLDLTLAGATITLSGTELDRRRVLGGLVREAMDSRIGGRWRLRRLLPDVDLPAVEAAVAAGLAEAGRSVDDIARQNLAVNLAIFLQRSGFPVPQPQGRPAPGDDPAAEAVLARVLETATRPVEEAGRAALRRLVSVALDDPAVGGPQERLAVADVVRRALEECILHFGLRVQREKLLAAITEHTRRLVARKATLVYFRTSLRESLRTRSPYEYDAAVYLAHLVATDLHVRITDDEISLYAVYLGLYAEPDEHADTVSIAIACPAYQTLREWLLTRVVAHLGRAVSIVDVAATVAGAEATGAELVVSTVGGADSSGPVVEISALCTELDLDAIRVEVVRLRDERLRSRTGAALARFLDERLFFVDAGVRDATQTIDFLCERMVAAGKVPPSYTDSVKVREQYSTTAFARRFAVPHSMDFLAHETTIAVLIPRAPIRWGESDVVMVLMLALNQADERDFTRFYQQLVHVLSDPDLFAELRRKRDFHSFRDYLAAELA